MNLFFLWFGGVKLWHMLARTARTFQADEGILMLLLLLAAVAGIKIEAEIKLDDVNPEHNS